MGVPGDSRLFLGPFWGSHAVSWILQGSVGHFMRLQGCSMGSHVVLGGLKGVSEARESLERFRVFQELLDGLKSM